jgi:hypothetical protein
MPVQKGVKKVHFGVIPVRTRPKPGRDPVTHSVTTTGTLSRRCPAGLSVPYASVHRGGGRSVGPGIRAERAGRRGEPGVAEFAELSV